MGNKMIKLERKSCPNLIALQNDYKNPENKKALLESSFDKCIYCESKISHIDYGDVEHIKPKSKYPYLKFEWSNLGIACTKCNRKFKNDNYDENTPFINPFEEDPSLFIISAGAFLFQKQGNERGEITILGLGLNRAELIEKRQNRIDDLNKAIDACFRTKNPILKELALKSLKMEIDEKEEYSFTVKALFKLHDLI